MSNKTAEVVAVQATQSNQLESRLTKITELAKAKSFYEKIKERESHISDLVFEDSNRNQSIQITDAEGYKFETSHFPILQEVKQILLTKIKEERVRVERLISEATI